MEVAVDLFAIVCSCLPRIAIRTAPEAGAPSGRNFPRQTAPYARPSKPMRRNSSAGIVRESDASSRGRQS